MSDASKSSGPLTNDERPWPALLSFTEEAKDYFKGRDQAKAELFRLVRNQTLSVVFGQSGLGKTSLLLAGLFPLLRPADFLPVYLRLKHGGGAGSYVRQVFEAIDAAARVAGVALPVAAPGTTLWEYFQRHDAASGAPARVPVIVLDQFEELFQSTERRQQAEELLQELEWLVENHAPPALMERLEREPELMDVFDFETRARRSFRIVVSLREDYLGELERMRRRFTGLAQNRYQVLRMNVREALAVVLEPARGLVAEDVAQKIVANVAGLPAEDLLAQAEARSVEPALLSVVLSELNQRRLELEQKNPGTRQIITAEMVSVSQDDILQSFYKDKVADLPQPVQAEIERSLLSDTGRHRVQCPLDGLMARGVAEKWVSLLVDRRILRYDERYGAKVVELTHDRLVSVVSASRSERAAKRRRRRWVRFGVAAAALGVATCFTLLRQVNEAKGNLEALQEAVAREAMRNYRFLQISVESRPDSFGAMLVLAAKRQEIPAEETVRLLVDKPLFGFEQELKPLNSPRRDGIVQLVYTADGQRVVGRTAEGRAFVFGPEKVEDLSAMLKRAGDRVVSIAAHPRDGALIGLRVAHESGADTAIEVRLGGATAEFISDNDLSDPATAASKNDLARLLRELPRENLNRIEMQAELSSGRPLSSAWAPHGNFYAAGTQRRVELRTARERSLQVFSVKGNVTALAFRPDGLAFVSGDDHGELQCWRVIAPERSTRVEESGALAGISPDGRWRAIRVNNLVGVFNAGDGSLRHWRTLPAKLHRATCLDNDGEVTAFSGHGEAALYRTQPGAATNLVAIPEPEGRGWLGAAWDRDGARLAVLVRVDDEGAPLILQIFRLTRDRAGIAGVDSWDLPIKREKWDEFRRTASDDGRIAFSPDGKKLVMGYGSTAELFCFDIATGAFEPAIPLPAPPTSVGFSFDNQTIVFGDGIGQLNLIERGAKPVVRTLKRRADATLTGIWLQNASEGYLEWDGTRLEGLQPLPEVPMAQWERYAAQKLTAAGEVVPIPRSTERAAPRGVDAERLRFWELAQGFQRALSEPGAAAPLIPELRIAAKNPEAHAWLNAQHLLLPDEHDPADVHHEFLSSSLWLMPDADRVRWLREVMLPNAPGAGIRRAFLKELIDSTLRLARKQERKDGGVTEPEILSRQIEPTGLLAEAFRLVREYNPATDREWGQISELFRDTFSESFARHFRRPDWLQVEGNRLRRFGNYPDAARTLREGLRATPNSTLMHITLGITLRTEAASLVEAEGAISGAAREKYLEAIGELQAAFRAAEGNPLEESAALYGMGVVWRDLREWQKAREHLEKALVHYNQRLDVLRHLIEVLVELRDFRAAEEKISAAVQEKWDFFVARRVHARLRFARVFPGENADERDAAALNRRIELWPHEPLGYYARAQLPANGRTVREKLQSDIADYTRGLELVPGYESDGREGELLSAEFLRQRGVTWRKLGDYEKARADLRASVEQNGEASGAMAELGLVERLRGDHETALAAFARADEQTSSYDAAMITHRAAAKWELGKPDVVNDLMIAMDNEGVDAWVAFCVWEKDRGGPRAETAVRELERLKPDQLFFARYRAVYLPARDARLRQTAERAIARRLEDQRRADAARRESTAMSLVEAASTVALFGEYFVLPKVRLDQALKKDSTSARLWIAAAEIYALQGDRARALYALGRAVAEPTDADSMVHPHDRWALHLRLEFRDVKELEPDAFKLLDDALRYRVDDPRRFLGFASFHARAAARLRAATLPKEAGEARAWALAALHHASLLAPAEAIKQHVEKSEDLRALAPGDRP